MCTLLENIVHIQEGSHGFVATLNEHFTATVIITISSQVYTGFCTAQQMLFTVFSRIQSELGVGAAGQCLCCVCVYTCTIYEYKQIHSHPLL
jgi:hypothetical protein